MPERIIHGKFFALFTKTTKNSIKMYKKLERNTIYQFFLAEKFKRSHFEFFCENVVRGNSVQIASNFPAKSLSIYLNESFSTLLLFYGNSLN